MSLFYLIHINLSGPETGRPFSFTKRTEFRSPPDDRIFLQKESHPREEFILDVDVGGSHLARSGQDLAGEVITSPKTTDVGKIKRLFDFLRQSDWHENEGHVSFDESPPESKGPEQ